MAQLARALPSGLSCTERHRFEPRPTHYFLSVLLLTCTRLALYLILSISSRDGLGQGNGQNKEETLAIIIRNINTFIQVSIKFE